MIRTTFFVGIYRRKKKKMKCLSFQSRFRTRVILFPDSSFLQVLRSFRTAACRIARTDIAVRAVGDEGRKFRYRGSKWFWVRAVVVGFPICEIAREIVRLWAEINDRPSIRYIASTPVGSDRHLFPLSHRVHKLLAVSEAVACRVSGKVTAIPPMIRTNVSHPTRTTHAIDLKRAANRNLSNVTFTLFTR